MKTRLSSFILFSLLTVFLFSFYSKILQSPNEFLFTNTGDGLKNYYTFNAFVTNNESYIHFDQMNYPYGEILLFIDCQPVLSSIVKFFSRFIPYLGNHSTGIFNLLLIFNLYLSTWIVFKLFISLTKNQLLSILGALGIVLFSPQILRLNGHYSLSYSFFILFTLHELIKYNFEYKSILRNWTLGIVIFLAYFTHAYLGVICSGLVLGAILIHSIFKLSSYSLKSFFSALSSGLIPLLVFYVFSLIIDSHTGRTTNPFGLLEYHSNLESILLPSIGIIGEKVNLLFPSLKPIPEGYAYIGLIGNLMLISLLFLGIAKLFSKKFRRMKFPNKRLLALFLLSLIFLLIAILPSFKFGAEKWIVDLPLVKQFRSVGRFAWVFYYLISIVSIYCAGLAFNYLINKRYRILAYVVILFVPLVYISESLALHNNVANIVPVVPSKFVEKNLDTGFKEMIDLADPEKYQAFLSVPYFNVGSENFELYRDEFNNDFAFLFNYHTKIPMFSFMSGRTSIWESKNQMQLFGSPYIDKKIKSDLPNGKPFLMLYEKSSVRQQELDWVNRTTKVYEDEKWYLGEIDTANFFYHTNKDEENYFLQHKNEYTEVNGFYVNNPKSYFKFNNFGNLDAIDFRSNENSLEIDQKDFTLLGVLKKDEIEVGKEYIASYWIYNDGENYGQDMAKGLTFFDKSYDNQSHWLRPHYKPLSSFEIQGNWSLVEISLTYTEPLSDHLIIFYRNYIGDNKTFIKDLLIYEKGLLIYKEYEKDGKKYLFKNNHRIEL